MRLFVLLDEEKKNVFICSKENTKCKHYQGSVILP